LISATSSPVSSANRRAGRGGRPGGGDPFSQTRTPPQPRSDMLGSLDVSFSEAALGTRRTVPTGSGGEVDVQIPAGVETGGGCAYPARARRRRRRTACQAISSWISTSFRPVPAPHGSDIELDLPVSVAEAALGAKVDVPTVEGRVTLSVPPGTSSGGTLAPARAWSKEVDGTRGDQFCRVEVSFRALGRTTENSESFFEESVGAPPAPP